MMIGAAVGAAILASTGGGYAYWAGYVGNRQGSVQNEINAELGTHGLSNVKVTVNHEWVASLAGTVPNQSEKDQAFGLVSGHKALKSIVNEVQIETSAADVEKNLNKALAEAGFSSVPTVQIDKDWVATLRGSANDQTEKDRMLALATGVAGVKGIRDEIEVAPETIPEPENSDFAAVEPPAASPPLPPQVAPQQVVDRAALDRELNARLRANGVGGVTGRVNPDMSVALSGTVRSADERNRALTIGGSLPGANGVRETIQIAAPQVVRLGRPQAPTPQAESPAQSSQAAAIDPAKLEGDINRALRSRDINSITAQVNDDMSLTLKGSASPAEKERALRLARQVRGIRGVKDKVFVVED
jgi:osmotically-inducible protein OsmY